MICPWNNNPINKLPVAIISGKHNFPLNSLLPSDFSHLGVKIKLPTRCLLCPKMFEGECIHNENDWHNNLKLAGWSFSTSKNSLEEAMENAKKRLLPNGSKAIYPYYLTLIQVYAPETLTLSELDEAVRIISRDLSESIGLSVFIRKNIDYTVILCSWSKNGK